MTIMKFPIIISLFILIAVWVCKAQECEETDALDCSNIRTDCEASYNYSISYNEDSSSSSLGYCTDITELRGIFQISCPDVSLCFKINLTTKCESCEIHDTQDIPCNCECTFVCISQSEEKRERDIPTMVTLQTKTQTPRSTVETIETIPSSSKTRSPRIVTTPSNQPTTTNIMTRQTRPPPISNNTRPSPPVILQQYLSYGLPMGVILVILVIALLISIIVCLCCRRIRSKVKDPESDVIAINTRNITPDNELANEPTYSSISETINSYKSNTDNNNNINNHVTTYRSENVYSQVESSMSLSEVTTPNGMIQNVLYNAFEAETDGSKNMYHVLVADNVTNPGIETHYMSMVGGEVINPSVYEKIPSLQSIDRANNVQGDKRESKIYIEPPKNLSELKEMLTVCMHELRAEEIEMGEEFASGQFGIVYRGKYRTSVGDVPVAIKTLKETVNTNKDMKVAFMREAAILAQFHHPNVLRLIGIVTTQQPWMMITELLKTELRQLLLQIRPAMLLLSSSSPSSSSPDKLRLHTLLLSFSQQIAAGMEHLAEKKFIHRDLAARNVLVAKDLSVRVADFGMSREIDSDNDYYSSSGGRVPLRWTSPEALFYKKYSEKSDVWSFGMTLYEIWSLGDKPWEGCKNDKVIESITNGHTPPQPVNCSNQMYQLMLQTWNRDTDSRPTFSHLKRQLRLIKIQ